MQYNKHFYEISIWFSLFYCSLIHITIIFLHVLPTQNLELFHHDLFIHSKRYFQQEMFPNFSAHHKNSQNIVGPSWRSQIKRWWTWQKLNLASGNYVKSCQPEQNIRERGENWSLNCFEGIAPPSVKAESDPSVVKRCEKGWWY